MRTDIKQWHDEASYFHFAGHRIAYWQAGTGPALLLVHGFPTSAWDWLPVWDQLIQGRKVIACDFLGFGLSDKPEGGLRGLGYALRDQADVLEALLDHCSITQCDAVVHDYGVSVGQELLARQAEGTGAVGLGQMVFLNGGIFPAQHRPLFIQKLGMSPLGFIVSALMNRKRFGSSFTKVFGPDTQPSEAELDAYWHFIATHDGHRNTHRLLQYIADRYANEDRWVGALHQSASKIGLINGALDPVSGKHAYDEWRRQLPDARHHLLDHVGHYPQVEAPDAVAGQIKAWLDL